jgi:DNA polymerase/3'-5' exonuclease PolX
VFQYNKKIENRKHSVFIAKAMASNVKQTIIDALDTLRRKELAEKQPFKANAYAKVIAQLNQTGEIQTMEDIQNMKGVGIKIYQKIKEVLETGQLQSAERAKEKYNMAALTAFQNIYGVGPAKATALVDAGFETIEQLREHLKTNPKILNEKQKIGLHYYEDLLLRIPREEMIQHQYVLKVIPEFEIVGSFRRELPTSGDIDVLIRNTTSLPLTYYVEQLSHYIVEVLALGDHKCLAICQLPGKPARRLDLLMTPDEEYAYSLLYFTGSDKFNVAFRQHALSMDYSLNEHTMTPLRNAPKIPYMKTEKDIFHFLGLRYVAPSKRVDKITKQVILLE